MNNCIDAYEAVIGLEVHVELKTRTKMFCSCSAAFGGEPNTKICPVCMGLPGAMPALNQRAVELGVLAGLATNCEIASRSKFDRKNYFYPDLPKSYQISQFDIPLCKNGYINIETDEGEKRIGITRIHLEEDAGKLSHSERGTLIDFNRSGVPLIEIVSEPDMRSPREATEYLKKLRTLLLYTGISDCKMNEGSMRCDVNISVRKKGDEALGIRTELKNINSFRFVEKAIEYEWARQAEALERGESILCETRRFDEKTLATYPMRRKETQAEYRFFQEPDLLGFEVTEGQISRLREALPMLPDERRRMYRERYLISDEDARILTQSPALADYFEKVCADTEYYGVAAGMILSVLMGLWEDDGDIDRIAPEHISTLCRLYGRGEINSATWKKLLSDMYKEDFEPEERVRREGLFQVNDRESIRAFVLSAIESSPKAVSDYKKGKATAARSIVGRAMGESRGRANPEILAQLVTEELNNL